MERQCDCGSPMAHPGDRLGCLECGHACCPDCAVLLESVWYCVHCAGGLLELPVAVLSSLSRPNFGAPCLG